MQAARVPMNKAPRHRYRSQWLKLPKQSRVKQARLVPGRVEMQCRQMHRPISESARDPAKKKLLCALLSLPTEFW